MNMRTITRRSIRLKCKRSLVVQSEVMSVNRHHLILALLATISVNNVVVTHSVGPVGSRKYQMAFFLNAGETRG